MRCAERGGQGETKLFFRSPFIPAPPPTPKPPTIALSAPVCMHAMSHCSRTKRCEPLAQTHGYEPNRAG